MRPSCHLSVGSTYATTEGVGQFLGRVPAWRIFLKKSEIFWLIFKEFFYTWNAKGHNLRNVKNKVKKKGCEKIAFHRKKMHHVPKKNDRLLNRWCNVSTNYLFILRDTVLRVLLRKPTRSQEPASWVTRHSYACSRIIKLSVHRQKLTEGRFPRWRHYLSV